MISKWIQPLIIFLLAASTTYLFFENKNEEKSSELVPNWNFSSAQGPNTYQYLANSFAFVLKQPANTEEWDMGEHEYSLFTIQRGTPEMICPSFSGVSIESSEVDLEPFVGKAVLVTGFTKNESSGAIHIEHIELDNAVNEKRAEYEQACPFPFQRMSEYMNGNP